MADTWSITDGYFDVGGTWHTTGEETRRALREAMGGADGEAPPEPPPMWFVEAGTTPPAGGTLCLEDGSSLGRVTDLPPDLPLGYHRVVADDGTDTLLVVTPRRCPPARRAWGWALQLYAVRSDESWGIGDLGDLARLARWASAQGAGVLLTNPLHADVPVTPQEPSPYFASSRAWRNINLLRVADVDRRVAARFADEGRALNTTPLLDRDAVLAVKRRALETAFARSRATRSFAAWRAPRELRLHRFAVFCALADRHGRSFHDWPSELRHPEDPAVAAFADAHAGEVRFHEWCQWHIARQLETAGRQGVGLIGDLAVGFEPGGADAWSCQDELALGCHVGAPPDAFNDRGQDWGLPPFVPWKLRAACYEPFITTVRAALTGCAGLRLDHVMGLFRLYWIPPGGDATDGAYVRYPHDDLFDLLALEATRAGAIVIGEDLGTVQDEVRRELSKRRVLSTKVVWFEDEPPERYPVEALATVTTHDLPTIAGVWTGADLRARQAMDRVVEGDDAWFRDRLRSVTGLADDAPVEDVIRATHERLARSPATLRLATFDDAVAGERRPNMPGTIEEWPNWRLPLPVTLEELERSPLAAAIAAALQERGEEGAVP